ncbi:MAG: hypothetical protein Ct9H300mP1_19540 [Planctomycetaceae bacterium]|nr:MAG: hypothetical protein Ct9H300mP1_19540 [Planctomycetaceae bacterium]
MHPPTRRCRVTSGDTHANARDLTNCDRELKDDQQAMTLVTICITAAGCGDGESKPRQRPPSPTDAATDDRAAKERTKVSAPDIELGTAAPRETWRPFVNTLPPAATGQRSPLVTARFRQHRSGPKSSSGPGAKPERPGPQGFPPCFRRRIFLPTGNPQAAPRERSRPEHSQQGGPDTIGGCAGPFALVKPAYEYIGRQLAPLGLRLDHERLKKVRPRWSKSSTRQRSSVNQQFAANQRKKPRQTASAFCIPVGSF